MDSSEGKRVHVTSENPVSLKIWGNFDGYIAIYDPLKQVKARPSISHTIANPGHQAFW